MNIKLFCLFLMLLFSSSIFSQTIRIVENPVERGNVIRGKIIATHAGFKVSNSDKNYLLVDVPNTDVQAIKRIIISELGKLTKRPSENIKTIGDSMVSSDLQIEVRSNDNNSAIYNLFMNFNWSIEFKSGKIKFNIPEIKNFYRYDILDERYTPCPIENIDRLIGNYSNDINQFFNNVVNRIVDVVSEGEDW